MSRPASASPLLLANPVFAAANSTALETLATGAAILDLPAEQIIFHAGDPADHVYVLIDGVVRVFHENEDGRQATVKNLAPPVTFAEMEVFSGSELLESTQTLTPVRLVRLDAKAFIHFVEREPASATLLLKDVCARFCVAARNESAILCDVPPRLASLLLSLADLFGKPTDQGIQIHKTVTQESLANGLGIVVRSVRRTLTDWRQLGWISTHKGWLVITKPAELEQLCRGLRFGLNYSFRGP